MLVRSQNRKSRLWKGFLTILCIPMFFGLVFSAPVLAHASEPASEPVFAHHHLNEDTLPIILNGQAGDKEVQLTWTDPNPKEELVGYQIIYSTCHGLSFDPPRYIAMIPTGDVQEKTINGLENETEYYFAIARLDSEASISGQSRILKLKPSDTNPPVTVLLTNPSLPSGQNHWFISKPEVTLVTNEEATTYYQWNSVAADGWQVYAEPLVAEEGENILYYYSVDLALAKNIEQTKWQIVKVDTIAPLALTLQGSWSESSDGIELSWNLNSDVARVEIWQTAPTGTLIASVPASQLSYLQKMITRGGSYGFKLLAYDEAGNAMESNTVSLQVPAEPVVITAVTSEKPAPQSVPTKKIKPAIGQGVSTVAEEIKTVETPKGIEGVQDQNPQDNNQTDRGGWNRLLIALSILIIAAGVAVGGYYGYEWMNTKSESGDNKKDSRW